MHITDIEWDEKGGGGGWQRGVGGLSCIGQLLLIVTQSGFCSTSGHY